MNEQQLQLDEQQLQCERWKTILRSKKWTNTKLAELIERHKSSVTNIVNGTTKDPECVIRVLKVVDEVDPLCRPVLPLNDREKFREYYGLADNEWWKNFCERCLEEPPEEEPLSYEEAIKRIEQYSQGAISDPILRGFLPKDEWKKRRERVETHLMLPLESIKHHFRCNSEGEYDKEVKT